MSPLPATHAAAPSINATIMQFEVGDSLATQTPTSIPIGPSEQRPAQPSASSPAASEEDFTSRSIWVTIRGEADPTSPLADGGIVTYDRTMSAASSSGGTSPSSAAVDPGNAGVAVSPSYALASRESSGLLPSLVAVEKYSPAPTMPQTAETAKGEH